MRPIRVLVVIVVLIAGACSLLAQRQYTQVEAEIGRQLFTNNCISCHRVAGVGSRLGPDLSGIGRLRRSMELQSALLKPATEVRPNNRFIRAVTQNGTTITGRLLNQDTFTVQLLDSNERLVSFSKSDLREFSFVTNSPMPSYQDKLSSQDVADLV